MTFNFLSFFFILVFKAFYDKNGSKNKLAHLKLCKIYKVSAVIYKESAAWQDRSNISGILFSVGHSALGRVQQKHFLEGFK